MPGLFKRPTPNKKVSAVKPKPPTVGASVGRGYQRFGQNPGINTNPSPAGPAQPRGNTTIKDPVVKTKQDPPKNKNTRGATITARNRKSRPDIDTNWNLPPCASSLPVRAVEVVGYDTIFSQDLASMHRYRRGAIWFYDTGAGVSSVDSSGNVQNAGDAVEDQYKKDKIDKLGEKDKDKIPTNAYGKYGFQFLWNPDQIQVSVARNMDVTPSNADRLRGVAGAFPGQESLSFTIILDRVNDFAMFTRAANGGTTKSPRSAYPAYTKELLNNYQYGLDIEGSATETKVKKLYDLHTYGTMADLEYLFKCINGTGTNAGAWKTLLGKETADIGFLSPTLLAFRFGENAKTALSYVGWITNLSISHTMFTEEMIPIRTSVSFSVDCFAGSTII